MIIDEKAKLRISLLPLVVIIGLILGAGYLLLAGDINLPNFFKKSQFRRIEGFPTIVYTSNVVAKQRTIIKSEEELTKFLNTIDSTGLLEIREPINFNKEYLVVAATETEARTGNTIRIKKISEDKTKNQLVVDIIETQKDNACEVDLSKNIALDIVAISKTTKEATFGREKQIESCATKDVSTK